MITSLLLGIDGSAASGVAAELALDLAGRLPARLLAVHADTRAEQTALTSRDTGPRGLLALTDSRQPGPEPDSLRRGRARLALIEREALALGVTCETREMQGAVLETLRMVARDCDMIVLGRQGISAEQRWHAGLGEVIGGVLHRAEIPVLVAGVEHEPLERVLLGVDGGRAMRHALASAVALAGALSLPVLAWAIDDDTGRARHHLDEVARYGETHGVTIDTYIAGGRNAKGRPAEALSALAEEGDLIAIGAFGAGALHEWLWGSTTASLLARTSRAVLLHH